MYIQRLRKTEWVSGWLMITEVYEMAETYFILEKKTLKQSNLQDLKEASEVKRGKES